MKIIFPLIVLICCFLPAYSQVSTTAKKELTYKIVDGHEIKATIFLPSTNGPHPVLIYFHGGGFVFGNKDQGLNEALKDKFLKSGFAVVSANYRLAPETKLNGMILDAQDAVKWIRQHAKEYSFDSNKIAVAGGSAGGYLAYATGFDQKHAPNAIITISSPTGFTTTNISMGDLSVLNQSGPYDIVKEKAVSHGDYGSRMELWRFLARNRLILYEVFGFDPSKEPEKLEDFKLTTHIDANYPPTLLLHAKNDHLVDLQQIQSLYTYLTEKKVISEMVLFDNGHSNELLNLNPQAIDKMIEFLNENME